MRQTIEVTLAKKHINSIEYLVGRTVMNPVDCMEDILVGGGPEWKWRR